MKLKNVVKKGLKLIAIYYIAMICVLLMAERVERLNELEKMESEVMTVVNFSK